MVHPEREREKQRSKNSRNRSQSQSQQKNYYRQKSPSDERQRRRSRDHKQHRENRQRKNYPTYKGDSDKYYKGEGETSYKPDNDKYYKGQSEKYNKAEKEKYNKGEGDKYDKYERSHSKKRSESSQSDFYYEEKEEEELQQTIRLGIRNGNLHYNKKFYEIFMQMPQRKQEELNEQAKGPQKIHECILVRELFISGLNDISEHSITELMGKYGEIQNIEIIKDFAFVKYYRVEDASNACADYHNINASVQPLINANFKIFFADHLKRWNVVSNNIDYQIRQHLVPVIYASVKNDPHYASEKYLLPIFQKYGYVRNLELRKNEFPGPKIHVNVEYETLEMALRARQGLKSHRQKFGEKKTELAILIDSDKITRVFPNVGNQIRYQKKRLHAITPGTANLSSGNSYTNLNSMDNYQSNSMGPGSHQVGISNNSIGLMNNPVGRDQQSVNSYQTEDIFAMLDKLNEKKTEKIVQPQHDQDSDWVGFFTRNNQFKVEVDFNRIHKDVAFELQSILNVSHRGDVHEALNRNDYFLAGKFKAANKLNSQNFSEYVKYFTKKNRGGIIFTNLYLIYLLPPRQDLNLPYVVGPNELLALFFKIKN